MGCESLGIAKFVVFLLIFFLFSLVLYVLKYNFSCTTFYSFSPEIMPLIEHTKHFESPQCWFYSENIIEKLGLVSLVIN